MMGLRQPERGPTFDGKPPTQADGQMLHRSRIAYLSLGKKRTTEMAAHIAQVTLAMNGKTAADLRLLHANVSNCCNWLMFRNYYTVDQVKLAGAHTCKKHILCQVCARLRAAKNIEGYMTKYVEIIHEKPALKPALLTLTVKNGPDLGERYRHLKNAYKRLRERGRDAQRGKGSSQYGKVQGAVYSYEFTNNGKGWHPHVHAIVMLDRYIDQKALSDEWLKITGDSMVVDIRALHGEPVDAFMETFKYTMKFGELSLADNFDAYWTLKGKRLLDSHGVFRGVEIPETLVDELLDDLPYLDMLYRYRPGGYSVESVKPRGAP